MNRYHVSVQKGAVTLIAEEIEAVDSVQILLKLALRPELQTGYNNVNVSLLGEAPGEIMGLLEPDDKAYEEGLVLSEEQWEELQEIGMYGKIKEK